MSAKRWTIVLLLIALVIVGLLAAGPYLKRWRINRAVAELQTPDAQKLGEVPRANRSLIEIGLQDEAVVSAVLRALYNEEARQRYWGARPDTVAASVPRLFDLLPGIGEPAVPVLIELLHDDDRRVRGIAADTLERMGAAAEPAIPALMKAANDPQVRENRYNDVNKPLDALIKLGRPAVPVLVECLKSEEHDIRLQAVEALYLMRSEAEEAAPDLVKLLVQPPNTVDILGDGLGVTPADALVRIGSPAIPPLKNALSHSDEAVRRRVEKVLQELDPQRSAVLGGARETGQAASDIAETGEKPTAPLPALDVPPENH